MAPKLKIIRMTYDRRLELQWKRSCKMLLSSPASDYLKEIICKKVSRRGKGTRRFFGEAYVAAHIPHCEGYYSSFKWLTNSIYLEDKAFPVQSFQFKFRSALQRFFRDDLEELQKNAAKVMYKTGIKPAAPDLWLVEERGIHRFIEVKLPKDEVSLQQIAGLSVIATSFRGKNVSVEIVELTPGREEEFHKFIDVIDSTG